MPNNSDSNIATADAPTLLLHNQHALRAAIEEVTKWLSDNGVGTVAENAVGAMETLDETRKRLQMRLCDYGSVRSRLGKHKHSSPSHSSERSFPIDYEYPPLARSGTSALLFCSVLLLDTHVNKTALASE